MTLVRAKSLQKTLPSGPRMMQMRSPVQKLRLASAMMRSSCEDGWKSPAASSSPVKDGSVPLNFGTQLATR